MRLPFPSPFRGRLGRGLFLARIVGLDRFGLDDHGRVGFLPVLGLGGDRSGDVARTQPESRSQRRQCRNQHGDDNLNDLLLCHNDLTV